MSEPELNDLRKRNIKKVLITVFSLTGLAAVITIITLIILNTISNSSGG